MTVATQFVQPTWRGAFYTFLISLALAGFSFLLQENIGLNLADEGFLWYGAIRTSQGDVPLRDFQSYDPGRYYWVAAWFRLFGQGIMSLRLSVTLFQVVGLTFGLLAARRVVKNGWLLGLVGFILLAWMLPRHKLFEPSLAMAAVYFAVRLIEQPNPQRHFSAGVFVGLAAFMGRNHGFYNFLAFFLLILFLRFKFGYKPLFKHLSIWLAGIIVGYAPMLFMLIFIPGLFEALVEWFKFLGRERATNLPLPIPWPWTVNYAQVEITDGASNFFIGLFFLLLPLFYLLAAIGALITRRDDSPPKVLLMASTFIGIFYMHYAFSRADLSHLAQSIHPLLLGLVALPGAFGLYQRRGFTAGLAVLLLISTIFAAIIPESPYLSWLRSTDNFVQYEISGDQLWLRKEQANHIDTVKQLVAQYAGPQDGLLIAPHLPGLYPILQRQSPLWETYLLFPENEQRQTEIINELEQQHVNWIILADIPLDGRDVLRFRHTHPRVWQYIMAQFEPIAAPGLPHNEQLFGRKPLP